MLEQYRLYLGSMAVVQAFGFLVDPLALGTMMHSRSGDMVAEECKLDTFLGRSSLTEAHLQRIESPATSGAQVARQAGFYLGLLAVWVILS